MNFGGKTQYGVTKNTPITVIRQSPERKDLQSLGQRVYEKSEFSPGQQMKLSSAM